MARGSSLPGSGRRVWARTHRRAARAVRRWPRRSGLPVERDCGASDPYDTHDTLHPDTMPGGHAGAPGRAANEVTCGLGDGGRAIGEREARERTRALQRHVEVLESLLRSSLGRDPRVDVASLKRPPAPMPAPPALPPAPGPAPVREDFAAGLPRLPIRLMAGLGGSRRRREAAVRDADEAFAAARARHELLTAEHERLVAEAARDHRERISAAEREVAEHNARVDALADGLRRRDRRAVSAYMEEVLRRSPYPSGFPEERKAGYVPESALLAVEFPLPSIAIIPQEKAFQSLGTGRSFRRILRAEHDIRQIYRRLIAQTALRTLREVFDADPYGLVSTVVFNGYVDAIDPVMGRPIRPHLITVRATREQFAPVVLGQVDPVRCVTKHFFAVMSPCPEELVPVEPIRRFVLADPAAGDPPPDLGTAPDLLGLSDHEFEAFVRQLFAKMGYDTGLFEADGTGSVRCVAHDPRPIVGGTCVVHATRSPRTVHRAEVRELLRAVHRLGATKGVLITTSGYAPDAYEGSAARSLSLVDGSGLLALCREHGIPARIPPR